MKKKIIIAKYENLSTIHHLLSDKIKSSIVNDPEK